MNNNVGDLNLLLGMAKILDPKASLSLAGTNILYTWKTDQHGYLHSRTFTLRSPEIRFDFLKKLKYLQTCEKNLERANSKLEYLERMLEAKDKLLQVEAKLDALSSAVEEPVCVTEQVVEKILSCPKLTICKVSDTNFNPYEPQSTKQVIELLTKG